MQQLHGRPSRQRVVRRGRALCDWSDGDQHDVAWRSRPLPARRLAGSSSNGGSGCVASTVTDPYNETNAWAYTLINLQPAWAAGYTGAGVTINIVDDGPDQTHPDFSGKYDALGSCPTHTNGSHGTTTAAIALAAGNDQCSRGVAYGATLSKPAAG